jgi:hypothetical protein
MKGKAKAPRSAKPSLRRSKTANFLKRIRENSMVEYFTQLRIMNPAAQLTTNLNEPRREGGFVRLAHARDEFTAPVLTKGKSVSRGRTRRSRIEVTAATTKKKTARKGPQRAK